jgi:hypothetical protein
MQLFTIGRRIAGRAVVMHKLLEQEFLIARRQIKTQTGLFNGGQAATPLFSKPLECPA